MERHYALCLWDATDKKTGQTGYSIKNNGQV